MTAFGRPTPHLGTTATGRYRQFALHRRSHRRDAPKDSPSEVTCTSHSCRSCPSWWPSRASAYCRIARMPPLAPTGSSRCKAVPRCVAQPDCTSSTRHAHWLSNFWGSVHWFGGHHPGCLSPTVQGELAGRTWTPPVCQASSSLLHEEKIAPVHSDFQCEASSLSLMGSAGRRPIAYTHSKCLVRRGLCQPRSDLSCHQLAGCLSNRRWGSPVRVDVGDIWLRRGVASLELSPVRQ